jgi:hypothetical protein
MRIWESSASRSRWIASATIPTPVSSPANRMPAATPAPMKHSFATIAEKGLRQPHGRKSGRTRQIAAPPSRISSGDSAAQSIVGCSKPVN